MPKINGKMNPKKIANPNKTFSAILAKSSSCSVIVFVSHIQNKTLATAENLEPENL